MLHDPRTRVISFTGSTEVGRTLLRAAADSVVNSAMELGGNAPFVVFDDADIEAAVSGAIVAKMRNMGEACTSANRFYVHDRVFDAFADRLAARMGAMRVGNGLDEGVEVGSLVNAETRNKVVELVKDAVARGAKVRVGGHPIERPGYFYTPTVLVDVPEDARCFHEEIFGPVAPLARFTDEADVLRRCNDTEYGLVAYVFTRDIKRGLAFSERLEFGMVGLNRGLVSDPAAAFGGMKQSGIGREGAHEGLMEFLETQYVSVEW
jgi:succinate-semialdehyde dehydrogenase/glutarate-semialdehyde dehydrogenase